MACLLLFGLFSLFKHRRFSGRQIFLFASKVLLQLNQINFGVSVPLKLNLNNEARVKKKSFHFDCLFSKVKIKLKQKFG